MRKDPKMLVRNLVIASLLMVWPLVTFAVEKAPVGASSSTNATAGKVKQDQDKESIESRAAAQVEALKLLNEAWSNDEPRVFEWNADQCREALTKYRERESKVKKDYLELYTDPALQGIQAEITKLSKALEEKRQEYIRRVAARKINTPDTEEITRKRDELVKELKEFASIQFRIETRLARLSALAAEKASTNAVTVVPQKVGASGK